MSEPVVTVVGYRDPAVAELERALQARYHELFGGGDDTVLAPEQFRSPDGVFLLLRVDGVPTAIGGWRARDGDGQYLCDGDAEIKRMYVIPTAQRRGHARRVLAELERTAAAAGRARMVLETSTRQPEALALYASSGYGPMGRFGLYAAESESRYYAKALAL